MSLKVGITGGIGSGKTTVCHIFEMLGIPVFYADDEAKKLMISDEILVEEIKTEFGAPSYFEDGSLNRKYISDIVFKNTNQLNKLNSFVHPAVFRAMESWSSQQKSPYVLKEAALLFESYSYQQNKFNILVSCPLELRIMRVMNRDQISKEKVLEIIQNQFSEEKKKTMADFFIQNNEEELIINQVLDLHKKLLILSNES
ncbi:MAG: dephospho-CoA kinase [Bacteroidetes bacterium]|nr:dephospho-CoA kinase [Bacteroidota bacterium]MBU1372339.1 dephospho-CoA kinase [Bacteroidota bacterium]MBU1484711.1 dephospho-CoA kinase [Bacteroidota bacterium]MBU1762127.1 dephospho-CoA kinase [Bacteroidota bacterium]MBU2045220.1 dephospho-CoA kinase [Bacteroidota bacterium]